MVEELQRVGADAHLAEPAQTSGLKGKKRRAKTDWADARHLRELLLIGRLPESWIAPGHLLDLRARVRCRHTLVEQRTEWQQRMHAVLYHHGVPHARKLLTLAHRERIAALKLPAAAREQLTIALEMLDAIELQVGPVDLALRAYARQHPGCRTLIEEIYGVGPLTSVAILAELGDTRRFQNSRDAVRYAGLDITVHQSDTRRSAGHLSRQGPPALRSALYEAAQAARRPMPHRRPSNTTLTTINALDIPQPTQVSRADNLSCWSGILPKQPGRSARSDPAAQHAWGGLRRHRDCLRWRRVDRDPDGSLIADGLVDHDHRLSRASAESWCGRSGRRRPAHRGRRSPAL